MDAKAVVSEADQARLRECEAERAARVAALEAELAEAKAELAEVEQAKQAVEQTKVVLQELKSGRNSDTLANALSLLTTLR
jgi:hypothetical protein